MPPVGDTEERSIPSGETSPGSQSHNSDAGSSPAISRPSTSSRSSMAPEVSALFRLLTEYPVDNPESENSDNLSDRLPGYQRVIFPREPTLLDILCQSSGEKDVHLLREVQLRVVASSVSLSRLGSYCPRVRILTLDGSGLSSLREIGTTLKYLRILHVARCGLVSLDGTFGLTSLQELHAQDNQIENVGPCAVLENIRVVILDRNPITCKRNVGLLSLCPNLTRLSLIDTPLSKEEGYRDWIVDSLPNLRQIDGILLLHENDDGFDNRESESESTSYSIEISSMTEPNSDDYVNSQDLDQSELVNRLETSSSSNKYCRDCLNAESPNNTDVPGESSSLGLQTKINQFKRPATALGVPSLKYSSCQPSTSPKNRPRTAQPRSCISLIESEPIFPDFASDVTPSLMTSGVIVCGSIGRALARARSVSRNLKSNKLSTISCDSRNINSDDNERLISSLEEASPIVSEGDEGHTNYHPSLDNVRRMLADPLPERPIESTPFIDLEMGVTGVPQGSSWEPSSDDVVQRSSKDVLRASRRWRKAFKMFRTQNQFSLRTDDNAVLLTNAENQQATDVTVLHPETSDIESNDVT